MSILCCGCAAAGREISKEEGGYRLSPSSTVLAWAVVVEQGSADCLCWSELLNVGCFLSGSAVSDAINFRLS